MGSLEINLTTEICLFTGVCLLCQVLRIFCALEFSALLSPYAGG